MRYKVVEILETAGHLVWYICDIFTEVIISRSLAKQEALMICNDLNMCATSVDNTVSH